MGHEPKDYDVATDARPDAVRALFPRAQRVGEAFGVMLVRRHGHTIEVATFRADGAYHDGRRPSSVTFTGPEEDAQRRDFTINGLFEDPVAGEIIDFVGGRADLEEGVLRAIGDPEARFDEDQLRMLRAARFAARLGFSIHDRTADAIRRRAHELGGVSRERIGHEVRTMLAAPSRTAAVGVLHDLRLDGAVLDELPVAEARGVRPLSHLGGLPPDAAYPTALAAWMLDRHDVPAGPGLASPDAQTRVRSTIERWAAALMLSNREVRDLSETIAACEQLGFRWEALGVAGRKRLAAQAGAAPALELIAATDPEHAASLRAAIAELARTGLAPDPLLTGEHLIADGLAPGPSFRAILDQVYDAQLDGRVASLDDARAFVRSIVREADSSDE